MISSKCESTCFAKTTGQSNWRCPCKGKNLCHCGTTSKLRKNNSVRLSLFAIAFYLINELTGMQNSRQRIRVLEHSRTVVTKITAQSNKAMIDQNGKQLKCSRVQGLQRQHLILKDAQNSLHLLIT